MVGVQQGRAWLESGGWGGRGSGQAKGGEKRIRRPSADRWGFCAASFPVLGLLAGWGPRAGSWEVTKGLETHKSTCPAFHSLRVVP